MSLERTYTIPNEQLRHLDITDQERIERFRVAGYGGNVSDALWELGVKDTVLTQRFHSLTPDAVLVGRALTVVIHTDAFDEDLYFDRENYDAYWKERFGEQGHPQKRMMRLVGQEPAGSVLCFDCGGDMVPAHFGEMSCQLAKAHGCRGMLIAGNARDTRYVSKIDDFPVFSFGTTPNAFGGWLVKEINVPILMAGHVTSHVRVCPGDFIFGDSDGVQVIPKEAVDEVLLRVEEIYKKENAQRTRLAEGMPIDEVYREFGVL